MTEGANFLSLALEQERHAHAVTRAALEALQPISSIVAENKQLTEQNHTLKAALDELQKELFKLVKSTQEERENEKRLRRSRLDALHVQVVQEMGKTNSKEDLMDVIAEHVERMRLMQ
jgi:predicted nuclease with TOPRIM domain